MNSILRLIFSFAYASVLFVPFSIGCAPETNERVAVFDTRSAVESTDAQMRDIYEELISVLPKDIAELSEQLYGTRGISELLSALFVPLENALQGVCSTLLISFSICMLMCLSELLLADNGDAYGTARGALSVILTIPLIGVMGELLSSVTEGIRAASGFFSEAVPLITSVIAIGVGGGTAASSAAGMSITLGFVEGVICDNLYLVFTAVFSLSVIGNLDTGQGAGAICRGFRSIYTFLLGTVSLILGATLAMGTALTASRDTLALRSARYAISGMVPVVGGIISGSIGNLISGARLISGAMGILGVLAVLYYMAAPLLSLLAFRFCLSVCITFAEFTASGFAKSFFDSVRNSIDCLIAPLTYSLIIYVLELSLFSLTVGALQ